ncbi:MAG: phosphatase PAP2 family protein [Verrucomicrobia bacterium]|nr:phosphatase PAP2 family protein [Verrucomicrobiota bacterium]
MPANFAEPERRLPTSYRRHTAVASTAWIIVAALVFAAILLALFADARCAAYIAAHTAGPWRHAAAITSRVGDWPAHVLAGVIGVVIAWFNRRKDWVRIFLAMLIACALAGVAARVIKIATGRARPSVKTELAWNGPRFSANYNAFPSGHTASSTAFFVALALARKRIGVPLLIVPFLIAAARLLAGAHYLSDVTFAAALGIACALLARRAIPSTG